MGVFNHDMNRMEKEICALVIIFETGCFWQCEKNHTLIKTVKKFHNIWLV